MTRNVYLKQMLAAVILFLAAGTTCAWAQFSYISTKSRNMLVEHKSAKFIIGSRLDVPIGDEKMNRLLSEKLFGIANDDVEAAYEQFLARFEKQKKDKNNKEYLEYDDGRIDMGIIYHGIAENRFNYSSGQDERVIDEEFVRLASRYEPFYCFIHNKMKDDKKSVVATDNARILFTYDTKSGRLLNISDVFTPKAISDLKIDPKSTNVIIRPKERKLSYEVTENGVTIIKELSFKNNADMLTESIVSYFASLLANREKYVALRAKKAEELNADIAKNKKNIYQIDNTSLKGMYLYVWDDTCYVSKLNKDIMTMTDSEIDALGTDKKCGYIAEEIRDARIFFANGERIDRIYKGETENEYKLNGNAYSEAVCDKAAVSLQKFDTKLCSGINGMETFSVRYVIDSTGCLRMPIVFLKKGEDTSPYIRKYPKLDEDMVSKLRKMGRRTPAVKDGKNVNVVCIYSVKTNVEVKSRKVYRPTWSVPEGSRYIYRR